MPGTRLSGTCPQASALQFVPNHRKFGKTPGTSRKPTPVGTFRIWRRRKAAASAVLTVRVLPSESGFSGVTSIALSLEKPDLSVSCVCNGPYQTLQALAMTLDVYLHQKACQSRTSLI